MQTKFLMILFAIVIFVIQNAFAQTDSQIAEIRAEVAAINKNVKKYQRETESVEGISLEGTETVFYSLGNNLKKVTAKMYGETYNASAEIFYKDDKPIFIYQKYNRYNTTFIEKPAPKIISVEETRAYYFDDQIIKILVGRKEIIQTDEKFSEVKTSFEDLSSKIFEAFKQ